MAQQVFETTSQVYTRYPYPTFVCPTPEEIKQIDDILLQTLNNLICERPQQQIWRWMEEYVQSKVYDTQKTTGAHDGNIFHIKMFKTILFLKNMTPSCCSTPPKFKWNVLEILSDTSLPCKPICIPLERINEHFEISPPFDYRPLYPTKEPHDIDVIRGTLTEIIVLHALKATFPDQVEISTWQQDLRGIDAIVTVPSKEEGIHLLVPIDIKCTTDSRQKKLLTYWNSKPGYHTLNLHIVHEMQLHPLILLILAAGVDASHWANNKFRTTSDGKPNQKSVKTPFGDTDYLDQKEPDGITPVSPINQLALDLMKTIEHQANSPTNQDLLFHSRTN